MRRLPLRVSLLFGAGLGRLIGLCAYGENARMAVRLRAALDTPPTPSACWADLGRRFVEFACAEKVAPTVEITTTAQARFAAAAAQNKGVLIATLHLGNWELMAAALSAHGIDFAAVGARPKHSPLHRWLGLTRATLGVNVLSPGGGAREAKVRLGEGGTLALFIDQATGERARPVRFFHAPAPTPTTYERLLALSDACPLLVWTARDPDGVHRVHAEDIPAAHRHRAPGGAPVEGPLDWLTGRAESLIRAYPTQWVWLHDRWRHHPGEKSTERGAPRRREAQARD